MVIHLAILIEKTSQGSSARPDVDVPPAARVLAARERMLRSHNNSVSSRSRGHHNHNRNKPKMSVLQSRSILIRHDRKFKNSKH
ncbi:MAG: hypothetical protein HQ478_06665 [Chloroflexi bacterium]|nr:hypothetical protein [Chloroflexota bacterium]